MKFEDYYDTLGVSPDASQNDIKRAFRKAARTYHPDVNSGPEAEAKFKAVNEAHEVLKDTEKRAAYDQLRQGGPPPEGEFRPPPGWDGGFSFNSQDAPPDGDFSDFFETLFRRGGQPRYDTRQGGRGPDQHARVHLDIEDAYHGAKRVLTMRMPEVGSDGEVRMRDHNISVKIPKGVVEGQHIRLAGQGMPGFGGGAPGDLFLEVGFAPHPVYRMDGRDLYLDLPVAPWEAALGSKIVMPTPDGKVDLHIPPNARVGQKLRLKGKGLPGKPPGDIYASLKIVNPKVTTDEARKFFEHMAREMPFDPRAGLGGS